MFPHNLYPPFGKNLGYKPSLVSYYHPILTLFVFENPLGSYGMAVLWRWYQNPNVVSLKVFKLLMHGINPIRPDKACPTSQGSKDATNAE